MLCLGEKQCAGFEVELGFFLKAVSHESCVGDLAIKVLDDLFGVLAERSIAAELARLEPHLGVATEGDELLFDGLIHHRVFVAEQLDERGDLGFGQRGFQFCCRF